jgi:hypothetical protein
MPPAKQSFPDGAGFVHNARRHTAAFMRTIRLRVEARKMDGLDSRRREKAGDGVKRESSVGVSPPAHEDLR